MKRKPAEPATEVRSITIPVPVTAAQAAAEQREAEADLATVKASVKVIDAETYEAADEILSDVHAREKALDAMRKSATTPLLQAKRVIDDWFSPALTALGAIKTHVKAEMGGYRLRLADAEREAREAAAVAADAGDSDGLVSALTEATAAAEKPVGKAAVGFAWRVARIIPELLLDEYWTPDVARIEAEAKAWRGDEPPVIPGVHFERVAKVGAR